MNPNLEMNALNAFLNSMDIVRAARARARDMVAAPNAWMFRAPIYTQAGVEDRRGIPDMKRPERAFRVLFD